MDGGAAPELGIASPVYNPDTTVRLSEDFAGSPFGFKLVGAETTIPGATATGPVGTPPHVDFTLTAQPVDGRPAQSRGSSIASSSASKEPGW